MSMSIVVPVFRRALRPFAWLAGIHFALVLAAPGPVAILVTILTELPVEKAHRLFGLPARVQGAWVYSASPAILYLGLLLWCVGYYLISLGLCWLSARAAQSHGDTTAPPQDSLC